MSGGGRSTIHPAPADHAVEDMLALLDHLGAPAAIRIGHDWGAPVVWSIAHPHPERCLGVVNLQAR